MSVVALVVWYVFTLYMLALLAWVVMSWIREPRIEGARRRMDRFFEPCLAPLRSLLKPLRLQAMGRAIDLSPLLLLIILQVLRSLVVGMLLGP